MASHIPSTSYAPSFENLFANEAPVAQRAAAPSRPMTRPEIVRDLTAWARDAGPNENRIKAKELILEAYDKKATKLDLADLWLKLRLTSLPECIGQLSNLERLYLGQTAFESSNQLTTLPKGIGQLSSLRTLELGSIQLTELPKEFGNLSNLEYLSLDHTKLTALPKECGNLSKLSHLLLLRQYGLPHLESGLESFWVEKGLRENRAESRAANKRNKIEGRIRYFAVLQRYIPDPAQPDLQELAKWVNDGNVNELRMDAKDQILWAYERQAIALSLDYLGLTSLPECICKLSNLQRLNLCGNSLTTLPSSLKDFWENRKFAMDSDPLFPTDDLSPKIKTCQEHYGNVTYFDPEPTQPTTSTSASPRVPLLVSVSFAEQHADHTANGLHLAHVPQGEQALTRMGLPTDLENNPACAHFFADLTRAMCNLHNINAAAAGGYSNTQASPWSRVASALLSNTGIPGVSVLGHLLVSFSRRFNETQAANEANSILGHFIDGEQFGRLTSHIAVRLTQALEPQLGVLLSQPTQDSSNLKAWVNGWKQALGLQPTPIDSPFASLIALVCIKELLETPRADNQTQVRNNYVVQLTDQLVPRVLNSEEIAQALVELPAHNGVSGPEADWTDVHEVSSSTQPPRGSDQPAQPSADEVVDVLELKQEVHRQRAEINRQDAEINQLRQAVQHQELLGNGRMQRQTHVNVNIIGGHAVAAPHETQRTVTAIDPEARQVVRDTNQRVDYHEARINLLEGALEGSGHNFDSDSSSHYPSIHRSGSGSSTNRRRTQMELNRLPRNWMKTEFTLPSMTEISADYLSKHDQAKAAVRFNNSEWQIQKSGKRSILGLSKWPTLSKALQEAHKTAHENPSSTLYTVQDDLNTLVTNLPKPFNKAANIFDEANQERLKAIVQGVLGRAQNA